MVDSSGDTLSEATHTQGSWDSSLKVWQSRRAEAGAQEPQFPNTFPSMRGKEQRGLVWVRSWFSFCHIPAVWSLTTPLLLVLGERLWPNDFWNSFQLQHAMKWQFHNQPCGCSVIFNIWSKQRTSGMSTSMLRSWQFHSLLSICSALNKEWYRGERKGNVGGEGERHHQGDRRLGPFLEESSLSRATQHTHTVSYSRNMFLLRDRSTGGVCQEWVVSWSLLSLVLAVWSWKSF